MEKQGSGTKMDENTACAGPGSDSKKVCIMCLFMAFVHRYFMPLKQF